MRERPSTETVDPDSLSVPDHPSWHQDDNYNPDVPPFLVEAYRLIKSAVDDPRYYVRAYRTIHRCRALPMCDRQRLRVCFIMALVFTKTEDIHPAMYWVNEAIQLASDLDAAAAMSDLLFLQGDLHAIDGDFAAASEDYADSASLQSMQGTADILSTITKTRKRAGLELFRGNVPLAEQLLEEARHLLLAHSDRSEAMAVVYIQALLDRAQGRPAQALIPVLQAAAYFTRYGEPLNAARVEVAATEISLDIAESLPHDDNHQVFVALARTHLAHAFALARAASDFGSRALALMTRMRLSRVSKTDEDRWSKIEYLIKRAKVRHDLPMLVQALTAEADELAAYDLHEAAIRVYRQVLHILDMAGDDLQLLGARARWALHRAGEHRS